MNKTETITIRVTKEDKERLQRLAHNHQRNLSQLVMWCVNKTLEDMRKRHVKDWRAQYEKMGLTIGKQKRLLKGVWNQ